MKIKIRPEHASMPQDNDWHQTDGWLADLRDDGAAGPPGNGHAEATSADDPWSEALAQADALAEARARAEARAGAQAAARSRAEARAEAAARVEAETAARAGVTVRAVIGDQLRIPIMWCEMGSCISWHADPAALGEADTRARAIGAGWRIDALGRLACPRCQQTDPFWAPCPVMPRDRYPGIARAAVAGDGTAGSAALRSSRDPGRAASGYPPARRAELEWHHDSPAARAMPPAGGLNAQPAPPLRRCGAEMRPGPGEHAPAAWRHPAKPVSPARSR